MQGLLPRVSNKILAGCANLQMPLRRYLALSIVPFIRNIDLSQGSWLQTEQDNADLSRISIIQHRDWRAAGSAAPTLRVLRRLIELKTLVLTRELWNRLKGYPWYRGRPGPSLTHGATASMWGKRGCLDIVLCIST